MDTKKNSVGLILMQQSNLKIHGFEEILDGSFFSKSEIMEIVSVVKDNYIHFIWFKFLYSFGMTLHELVNLKIEDIDFNSGKLNIHSSKKLLPRSLDIPKSLLCDLRIHGSHKCPGSFIFQGRSGKLNTRTIQKAMEKVETRLKIKLTIAKIRKSIAVHLLQNGWDYKEIGEFLGHAHYRATKNLLGPCKKKYLQAKSPADDIFK